MRVESIPTFHTTVTVFHLYYLADESGRRHAAYKRTVYKNCFWKEQRAQNTEGTEVHAASTYICRLPVCSAAPGDVIFKGTVSESAADENGKRITDLIEKYKPDCFTVQTVCRNDSIAYFAHTRAEGV